MKRKALKEGDYIRIKNPVFVTRYGYNLNKAICKKSFTDEDYARMEKLVRQFFNEPESEPLSINSVSRKVRKYHKELDKIADALAFIKIGKEGWGGNERKLFTQEIPELKEATATIIKRKVVKTGTRFGPQSYIDYWGEYDYEPGGLDNEKTHVLYQIREVYAGNKYYHLDNIDYEIQPNSFFVSSGTSYPVYIEKTNIELVS